MKFTKVAQCALEKRILAKDKSGCFIEDAEGMFKRVADAVSKGEKDNHEEWAEKFYDTMTRMDFLPNSPTLANAGLPLGMLSACFVLPIRDSIDSIFKAQHTMALIQKAGGGTGFDFSKLRPAGDYVEGTGGFSSGPITFMMSFDAATATIKQGGKRRGANLATMRCDHPDIMSFIACKSDFVTLTNFNISMTATDQFMKAVNVDDEFDLINPNGGEVVRVLHAKEMFNEIAEETWRTGDPGMIFLDEINRQNQTPLLGSIATCNPCGEQPLYENEACNLGSINISHFASPSGIDYDRLLETVVLAVRFLNCVVNINKYPLPAISEATHRTRKIGLGPMGWADALVTMNMPYDSEDAVKMAGIVMELINMAAVRESEVIATEQGAYPAYSGTYEHDSRCNAAVTTIAPTGTLSTLANCSSGIEPFYAMAMERNILDGETFIEVNKHILRYSKVAHEGDSVRFLAQVEDTGSVQDTPLPPKLKEIFKTAHEINWKDHVNMQAAFQVHTHNAVSKTVNVPNSTSVQDIKDIYQYAWGMKCKGITIYRDGSREEQVLIKGIGKQAPVEVVAISEPLVRPHRLRSTTDKIDTSCGNMYISIGYDEDDDPFEAFLMMGKGGGCASSHCEAIGRLISLALRSKVPMEHITKQLRGIQCHSPKGMGENKVTSCADAVSRVLLDISNHSGEPTNPTPRVVQKGACPDCGGRIICESGCFHCNSCEYSECG